MWSQQTGLAGLFLCRAFQGGEAGGSQQQVCSWQESSPTLTSSPSHPISARFSPCLAASSTQSPPQPTLDDFLSRGLCFGFAQNVRPGGEANPATWLKVQSYLPLCPLREEMGSKVATNSCCIALAPYCPSAHPHGTGPNNSAPEKLFWLLPSLLHSLLCHPVSMALEVIFQAPLLVCAPRSYLMVCKYF